MLLLVMMILLSFTTMMTEAQWLQPGFNSIHSNESPYNVDDVSGVCTMWTSVALSSPKTKKKLLVQMKEIPQFSVLQTNDTSGNYFIVYKNVILNQETGVVVTQWSLDTFGYVIALSSHQEQQQLSVDSTGVATTGAEERTTTMFLTLKPADSEGASSLLLSAYVLNDGNEQDAKKKKKQEPLRLIWANEALRISNQFELIVDEQTRQVFVYFAGPYALHVSALHLETGHHIWDATYFGDTIGGMVVSEQRVYLGVTYVNETGAEHSNMIVCLDAQSGHVLWKHTSDFSFQRVFTLLESERLLVASAVNKTTNVYYTVAYNIDNGEIEFDHSSFFEFLTPNAPILSVAQVSGKGSQFCANGTAILVSRKDGLFTLCASMVNHTSVNGTYEQSIMINGTYWTDSMSKKSGSYPTDLLSLSDTSKNVILLSSDSVSINHIMLYGQSGISPSHCGLRYHSWKSPIQGSKTRYIFSAAEATDDTTFRIIAMDPKNCRNILPLCPLFEIITKQRIAGGFIVLIALNVCCAVCCTLCCCYCCKECNPQKSASSACYDCSRCCDVSYHVANVCESMNGCMERCCPCLRQKSAYLDTFPDGYESDMTSALRYQLKTNMAENDEYVYIYKEESSSDSDYDDQDSQDSHDD